MLTAVKFIEIRSRVVGARGWQERKMGSRVVDTEFQVCKMENVLEMDGGDDRTTLFNATEPCTLKW